MNDRLYYLTLNEEIEIYTIITNYHLRTSSLYSSYCNFQNLEDVKFYFAAVRAIANSGNE